jgi:hypothetical protein
LDAQNASTRSTGIALLFVKKKKTDYNDALHSRRLIENTDVLASLRSDHDALECAITMVWTK